MVVCVPHANSTTFRTILDYLHNRCVPLNKERVEFHVKMAYKVINTPNGHVTSRLRVESTPIFSHIDNDRRRCCFEWFCPLAKNANGTFMFRLCRETLCAHMFRMFEYRFAFEYLLIQFASAVCKAKQNAPRLRLCFHTLTHDVMTVTTRKHPRTQRAQHNTNSNRKKKPNHLKSFVFVLASNRCVVSVVFVFV